MCFDPQLKQDLLVELAACKQLMGEEAASMQDTGGVSERFKELMRTERDINDRLNAIPHRFEVGDGCHSGGNGDRYPYRVVAVSKNGKTATVQRMGYRADPTTKNEMGHQNWIVFDLPPEETHEFQITLRTNGRWATKGQSSLSGYGNFYPGAVYSYNWEF